MSPPIRQPSRPFGHAPRPAFDLGRDERAERIAAPPAPGFDASDLQRLPSIPPPVLTRERPSGQFDVLDYTLKGVANLLPAHNDLVTRVAVLEKLREGEESMREKLETAIADARKEFATMREDIHREKNLELRTQVTTVETSRAHVVADANEDSKWRTRFVVGAVVGAVGFVLTTLIGVILWLLGKK